MKQLMASKPLASHAIINPLCPCVMNSYCQNFDFKIRRDHQKISYERRDYESVGEKSLS